MIALILNHSARLKKKKNIEHIKRSWGRPKSKNTIFEFNQIANCPAEDREKFHRLTDQTLEDIDFNGLFKIVDRTTSKVGQQYLFKTLTEPTEHVENPLEKYIQLLNNNQEIREQVQLELLRLNDDDAYTIPTLLSNHTVQKPKWFWLLPISLACIACLIALSFLFPVCLILLIIPVTTNMYVHLWNKSNTFIYMRSIPQLNILINVAKNLSMMGQFSEDTVKRCISQMRKFQKRSRYIRFKEGGLDADILQYAFDMTKAFFLVEAFMLFKILDELKNKRSTIITLFEYVGKIDTAISIASLRVASLKTCQPVFTSAEKGMKLNGVYHPIVKDCVPNDIEINGKSVLITGSNMSGKSTFLRTIAINSILAQTIYTCFAEEYSGPILKPFSSIRIDDNLFDGKSYFFEEVSVMGNLIEEADLPAQSLFLLDEVFKGTNTIERVAAAKAILSYLNGNNNIVLVATHDIELANMLKGKYDLYHFAELIENNQLHFDYTIKSGPLKTRNAIKLLELAEYPKGVIDEAKRISNELK